GARHGQGLARSCRDPAAGRGEDVARGRAARGGRGRAAARGGPVPGGVAAVAARAGFGAGVRVRRGAAPCPRGGRGGAVPRAPHHTRPWLFVALTSDAAKRRLLAAMAAAWRDDLEGDGTPEHVIRRRLEKSDALLGAAPAIVVPFVRLRGAHSYPDDERASA